LWLQGGSGSSERARGADAAAPQAADVRRSGRAIGDGRVFGMLGSRGSAGEAHERIHHGASGKLKDDLCELQERSLSCGGVRL
jgi:hypothetical protein